MIKDEMDIPVAIFNGADGGKPISFFDRPNDYASSTNSNYGRLFYRLSKTGLKNFVRAILWSQGEADSFTNGLSTSQYISSFENLMSFWDEDYPSIEKYFIFQTRDCNCGTISSGRKKIKEAQRQLAIQNSDVNIMPTTGMQVHTDNCHFPFVNGYEKFAQRIFPQVSKELYGGSWEQSIYAPMLTSISLSGNILELTTDSEGLVKNTTNDNYLLNKLNEDFIFSDNTLIEGFEINGNKLIFQLSQIPSNNAKLSFIGLSSDLQDNITNFFGTELVSFSDLCILSDCGGSTNSILPDDQKKPGVVYVEDGNQNTASGRMYRAGVGIDFATRSFNGNSNDRFGNIGDWSVDLVVSEKTPQTAAEQHGGFKEENHPLYNEGDGNWSMISEGLGAVGWGSFTANAYNRASGLGSVYLGFTEPRPDALL